MRQTQFLESCSIEFADDTSVDRVRGRSQEGTDQGIMRIHGVVIVGRQGY
ncbi:hypothetical protein [Kaistia soli]|nr:hypothetical protein [Kaistia soli]